VYNISKEANMYVLRPDERVVPVMLYAQNSMIRGEAVVKQNIPRVNIWLRTDGAPKYMHILKAQVLLFGGTPVKSLPYSEVFFPTSEAIAFHPLPPVEEPLDYDLAEADREMDSIEILAGTFVMKGRIRISTHMEVATTLEVARVSWLSVYDVWVSNPYLPQMPALQVPMVVVNPSRVTFGVA
jgi:hypothetical protein